MPYLVESRWAVTGWADAHWTEVGPEGVERPLRFETPEEAEQAIVEFIAGTRAAEISGDMISRDPTDYRPKLTFK